MQEALTQRSFALGRVTLVLCALVPWVAFASPAAADEPGAAPPAAKEPAPARPWAEGVSDERQSLALRLYQEGNKLFEESQPAAALTKYREALEQWEHPAIRYNVAAALVLLDQVVAAHENLELALRHGDAPFSPDRYQQALTYRKLIRGQLAHLEVACSEPGAEVTLDGATLLRGPGKMERWLLPGRHQLVAGKAGFHPAMRSLLLVAGKSTRERLELHEVRSAPVETTRRWAPWKPWAVVGAGALVALAATPVLLAAQRNFDTFDAAVVDASERGKCDKSMGCPEDALPAAALEAERRGKTQNAIAASMFAVGGVLAATGAVLVILNQPRQVTPVVAPGLVGLSISFR